MSKMAVTVTLVVLLDQIAKFFIASSLYPGQSISIIKNVFHITFVYNSGAAFGIFPNAKFFFILISVAAIVIIFMFLTPRGRLKTPNHIYLSLILAGAIGNLIDRIRLGYVIDFLDFRIWPVFNVADSAITLGVSLLIFRAFKTKVCNT